MDFPSACPPFCKRCVAPEIACCIVGWLVLPNIFVYNCVYMMPVPSSLAPPSGMVPPVVRFPSWYGPSLARDMVLVRYMQPRLHVSSTCSPFHCYVRLTRDSARSARWTYLYVTPLTCFRYMPLHFSPTCCPCNCYTQLARLYLHFPLLARFAHLYAMPMDDDHTTPQGGAGVLPG